MASSFPRRVCNGSYIVNTYRIPKRIRFQGILTGYSEPSCLPMLSLNMYRNSREAFNLTISFIEKKGRMHGLLGISPEITPCIGYAPYLHRDQ